MLATDNIKVPSLSNNSYCNCNNTTVPHCFHFRHSSLIITLYCTYEVDSRCFRLLFYRPTQRSASNFSSISFRCSHSQEKLSPSKMYSHGTFAQHYGHEELSFTLSKVNDILHEIKLRAPKYQKTITDFFSS